MNIKFDEDNITVFNITVFKHSIFYKLLLYSTVYAHMNQLNIQVKESFRYQNYQSMIRWSFIERHLSLNECRYVHTHTHIHFKIHHLFGAYTLKNGVLTGKLAKASKKKKKKKNKFSILYKYFFF